MKRQAGFSLLELVAVMAIFAIVALIGAQVIQASVRSNERLSSISDQSQEIVTALTLLRRDLNSATPRTFVNASGQVFPPVTIQSQKLGLAISGLAPLSKHQTGFGYVEWQFNPSTKALSRALWTSLTPGATRTESATVLHNVMDVQFYSRQDLGAWQQGFISNGQPNGRLPDGIKVVISHEKLGTLEIVESLK